MSRKFFKWFLGLVGLFIAGVVTTIATVTTTGLFGGSSTQSPSVKLTQVRLMQPFSLSGQLLPPYKDSKNLIDGTCTNSLTSADPEALRCYSGNLVLDPCWSSFKNGVEVVACLLSPEDSDAIVITRPHIIAKPEVSPFKARLPWAIEIINPGSPKELLRCVASSGGTGTVDGMRVNWVCGDSKPFQRQSPRGYAIGNLQVMDDKPWTVFYAGADSSQAVEATVVTVWR
jgi:hypothetical protein